VKPEETERVSECSMSVKAG